MTKKLVVILGNQLFPAKYYKQYFEHDFFMAESYDLCTYYKHHKLKILLFLSAMRSYSDNLKLKGVKLTYAKLSEDNVKVDYIQKLKNALAGKTHLVSYEVEDKFLESKIKQLCEEINVEWEVLGSPLFVCSRTSFKKYLNGVKKPFMKSFYEMQRKKFNILIDKSGKPIGGKWSYDGENRKKIPKGHLVSDFQKIVDSNPHIEDVKKLVINIFGDHPGDSQLSLCVPTTREGYLKLLKKFMTTQLVNFGKYQDAISDQTPFLYHSLLSPGINMGLILPGEIITAVEKYYRNNLEEIPLSSVEGFIRQIVGWREFVRGIYQNYSSEQDVGNFWGHNNKLSKHWYDGTTGIPPVDDAIKKANRFGYNHHIERLMVLSSIMLLCEIEPQLVHKWFMEMYIDSSDWVMGPNVYGMGQFSDGGIFATKPYICGSNYILKMSHYKKGDWCEIMDGLYWRFIEKNLSFFNKSPRMKMMASAITRMDGEKKKRIIDKANKFIKEMC